MRRLAPLCLCVCLLGLVGCERREATLARIGASAPTLGRAATLDKLRATPEGGLKWLPDAAMLAHDKFKAGEDATLFAAAILDTAALVRERINPQAYFFLTNLGALAFISSLRAYEAGNLALASDLVTGGSTIWQTEAYWLKYPQHEALRARILFDTGKRTDAIRMLEERASITGEEALEETLSELKQRLARNPGR